MAISNSRPIALDERGVTFRWKDYRVKGHSRHKAMTLDAGEFMLRFLLHVLPGGFHRIRHYDLLLSCSCSCSRSASLDLARQSQAAGSGGHSAVYDDTFCQLSPSSRWGPQRPGVPTVSRV